jgi:LacI family transcriptional regulator
MNIISKKITMQHIADRLGVSKYTVSQALSGKDGVGVTTRNEVAAMARSLGYELKPAKRSAASSNSGEASSTSTMPTPIIEPESRTNGRISGDFGPNLIHNQKASPPIVAIWIHEKQRDEPSFWSCVIKGAVKGCEENGWLAHILSIDEHGDQSSFASDMVRSAAGSIVIGTLPVTRLNRLMEQQRLNVPVVLVDHEEPLMRADCVLNANLEAAQWACRHILSQGCKKLLFIGRDSFSVSFKERWWGCRQVLDEFSHGSAGYSLKKWTLSYGQPLSIWEQQLARKLTALPRDELPDGFVCANDEIALKLLELLRRQSVDVPQRCRVVGIDNVEASASSIPPLTTVELAKERLGHRAVEALARKMIQPGVQPEKIVLSARLIIRGSG